MSVLDVGARWNNRRMDSLTLQRLYSGVTSADIAAIATTRRKFHRSAPRGIHPIHKGSQVVGRARIVRYDGRADPVLKAITLADPGDVLVLDNMGRRDEACIDDLVALESQFAGLSGIVAWGEYLKVPELKSIRLPIFSLGACPTRSQRTIPYDHRFDWSDWTRIGRSPVGGSDFVFADDDAVMFLPTILAERIAGWAMQMHERAASRDLLLSALRSAQDFEERGKPGDTIDD